MGTGHVGCALAADLMNRRFNVMLWAELDHRKVFNELKKVGNLEATGQLIGKFRPEFATCSGDVVITTRFIFIAVPSYGHASILAELKKYDLTKHIIVALAGNFFSLVARKEINAGLIVDASASPYASRLVGPKVAVSGIKDVLPVAALQSVQSDQVNAIKAALPMRLDWLSNVLALGFSCVNGVLHPLIVLMNAALVQAGEDWLLYVDGVTPEVGEQIEAMDKERVAGAAAFDLKIMTFLTYHNTVYSSNYSTVYEFAQNSPPHKTIFGPKAMDDRSLSEDVPYLLVPWEALFNVAGVKTPIMTWVIDEASRLNNVNYRAKGRTLEKLGLAGLSLEEIKGKVTQWQNE
jgi:opine dehydrogenase